MTSTTKHHTSRAAALVVLLCASAGITGCNIIAPIFFLVSGPETFEAEYKLPSTRSAIVFVDDPRSILPRRALRLAMLRSVEEVLLDRDLVDEVISGQAALQVADADTSGGRMPITSIGRAAGADIVVWVTVDSFIRADQARNVIPEISMRVRLIDAEANELLYPSDTAGRFLRVKDNGRRGSVASNAGAQAAAEIRIAQNAGRAVAQLFYEYPVTQRIAERGL